MNRPSRILVTGATGFLGSALVDKLSVRYTTVRAVRLADAAPAADTQVVGDVNAHTDWREALIGVETVVHCAARAHIMHDATTDPLAEYRRVNVEGSLNLARQAAEAGVKRFVFISSIKVNGESTSGRHAFTEQDAPNPQDAYGQSKYEAEQALLALCAASDMELVLIRPPLLYGAGVKANFRSLMKLAGKRIPLPFAAIHNQRSMLYLGNLLDFIVTCIEHPGAAHQIFVIADGEDISLSALLALLRKSFGHSPLLLPVPVFMFRVTGRLAGKGAMVERLVGDLQVDIAKARHMLGWQPPYTVEQGIAATVAAFLAE